MDENYLDNLLNEISLDKEIDHKIEDELDSQMRTEKRKRQAENEVTKQEAFDLELEKESFDLSDSLDLEFSETQMDELDELDNLADLDMGDLDFSDIDFDDVDIMRLETIDDEEFEELLKDFEGDLQIDDFFNPGDEKKEPDIAEELSENTKEVSDDGAADAPISDSRKENEADSSADGMEEVSEPEVEAAKEELNEDSFDTNAFLDSLLNEAQEEEADGQAIEELPEKMEMPDVADLLTMDDSEKQNEAVDDRNEFFGEALKGKNESLETAEASSESTNEFTETSNESEEEIPDLDDLLSMLDMEVGDIPDSAKMTNVENTPEAEADDTEALLAELDGLEELEDTPVKKKRSLMQILFGNPDDEDDELSQEELEAVEIKRAEKAAKKAAAKAAKQEKAESNRAKKALADDKKKQVQEEKERLKAEKKAMLKAETENLEPEKKLSKPVVVFIFTLFLGGVFLLYTGVDSFSYSQAIEKAANYFAKQKYHRAYDEIVGVDVKEKDEDLKERIYTVMYVERLYESYNNNIAMKREEKALDALLRGVVKYYEHYEDAQELGIVSDLDYSFAQITDTLQSRYGISVERALEINAMNNLEYVQTIQMYVDGITPQNDDTVQ